MLDPQQRSRTGRRRHRLCCLADRDEPARVVLARRLDDLLHRAVFDHLAVAQHHDVVGDLRDDGEVVGDVERRGAGLVDGALDRREHVDLGGHVERGRRLVEDDEVGLRAERHRRHRALQLAARDLVRIAVAERVRDGKAEHAEELARAQLRVAARHQAMFDRGLHHLVADAVAPG